MWLFCERQAKDLHEYLFQITEESGREVGKGFRGREEGVFDGVFEKQRRRGSGWQPLRIRVSWRSGSKGQVEKGV